MSLLNLPRKRYNEVRVNNKTCLSLQTEGYWTCCGPLLWIQMLILFEIQDWVLTFYSHESEQNPSKAAPRQKRLDVHKKAFISQSGNLADWSHSKTSSAATGRWFKSHSGRTVNDLWTETEGGISQRTRCQAEANLNGRLYYDGSFRLSFSSVTCKLFMKCVHQPFKRCVNIFLSPHMYFKSFSAAERDLLRHYSRKHQQGHLSPFEGA